MPNRRLIVAALMGLALLVPAGAASAADGYPRNPTHNIALPSAAYGSHCTHHPTGQPCDRIMIRALDHARGKLKEPKYRLPSTFASLPAAEQLLLLSNADRRLYGLTTVRGLNGRLDASARKGVRADADPDFVYSIAGASLTGGGSNWFGGSITYSPLLAYYEWMYDDGPGSGNVDCPKAGAPGCWGHRDDTLFRPPSGSQVELGVGSGKDRRGSYRGRTELYESFPTKAAIPCVPSVVLLSTRHAPAAGGSTITLHGLGFVDVSKVTVLGSPAHILSRSLTTLRVRVPQHAAGAGHVVVVTAGGHSVADPATAFAYR